MAETIASKSGARRRASGLLALLRAPEAPAEEPGPDAFVAALSEPAVVASVEGRILAANGAWRELFGRSARDRSGAPATAARPARRP